MVARFQFARSLQKATLTALYGLGLFFSCQVYDVQASSENLSDRPSHITPQSVDDIVEKMAKARNGEEASDLEEQLLLALEQSGAVTAELLLEWSRQSLEQEAYAHSLELANKVEKAFPDMAVALYYQSLALSRLKHHTRAIGKIIELIDKEPRFVQAYQLLAEFMVEFNRKDLAIIALRQGLKINPKSQNLLDLLKHVSNGFERST